MLDAPALVRDLTACGMLDAQRIADSLLAAALEAEDHRPGDDMSAAVLAVTDEEIADGARRIVVSAPL